MFKRALDAAGKIWAVPNTAIGLVYGALGHVIGKIANAVGHSDHAPHVSLGNNAIQFENNPLVTTAITLGNVTGSDSIAFPTGDSNCSGRCLTAGAWFRAGR